MRSFKNKYYLYKRKKREQMKKNNKTNKIKYEFVLVNSGRRKILEEDLRFIAEGRVDSLFFRVLDCFLSLSLFFYLPHSFCKFLLELHYEVIYY